MNTHQCLVLQSLVRGQQFLEVHKAALAPVFRASAVEDLDEMIGQIQEYDALHATARAYVTYERQGLRRAMRGLRDVHMRPIADIAANHLGHTPEIAALACPSSRLPAHELLAAAAAMVDAICEHPKTFVIYGLAPDFEKGLVAAIDEVGNGLMRRAQFERRAIGATRAMEGAFKRARVARRSIDALLEPVAPRGSALRKEWIEAKALGTARAA